MLLSVLMLLTVLAHPISALDVQITANTQEGVALLPIELEASVSGGGGFYQYFWDFDDTDGVQVDKIGSKVTWLYAFAGTYKAQVDVSDSEGNTGSAWILIQVDSTQYQDHTPIEIIGQDFDPPYVIEGYRITNETGNAINIINCSNIIIRNNYIHDTDSSKILTGPNHAGTAIYVQDSHHIKIEGNLLMNNLRGMDINATPESPFVNDITVSNNVVVGSKLNMCIFLYKANHVEIGNNYAKDNGDVAYFENNRITGIITYNCNYVNTHDNICINSSSDGISSAISDEFLAANPDSLAHDINIFNNTCRGNGEQGIWLYGVTHGNIYNNYSEGNYGIINGSRGIMFEWNCSDINVFRNMCVNNQTAGISLNRSSNNIISHNICYEPVSNKGGIWLHISPLIYQGQYLVRSQGNIIKNNIIYNSSSGIMIEGGMQPDESSISNTLLENNTIVGNGHGNLTVYPGGVTVSGNADSTTIRNNIIVKNLNHGIRGNGRYIDIGHNDIWDNTSNYVDIDAGLTDFSYDPLFKDISDNNFHLLPGSPCIDAGDPRSEYQIEPMPNGGRINLGAYGNTVEATCSGETSVINRAKIVYSYRTRPFPNPYHLSSGVPLTFHYLPDNTELLIFDILGRTVLKTKIEHKQNEYSFFPGSIGAQTMQTGIYFFLANDSWGKFVILK